MSETNQQLLEQTSQKTLGSIHRILRLAADDEEEVCSTQDLATRLDTAVVTVLRVFLGGGFPWIGHLIAGSGEPRVKLPCSRR